MYVCFYVGWMCDFIGQEAILEEKVYLSTKFVPQCIVFSSHSTTTLGGEGIWEGMPRIGIE